MRRTRRLTSGEKWELGLFLSLLLVGFLCLTAILNLPTIPKLFAAAFRTENPSATGPMTTDGGADRGDSGTALDGKGTVLDGSGTILDTKGAGFPGVVNVPAVPAVPGPQLTIVPPALSDPAPAAPRASFHKKPAVEVRYYNGRKYRYVKTLRLRVTAYSPDSKCCWPYPGTTTASGLSVKTNHGKLVAADTRLIPMHALVSVPGYAGGATVPVLDRGGAIKGYRMDVLMPKFETAKEWGSRVLAVKIYMPVEE
ncbi:MAG: 3D domain-containing protein [Phycisphaerae bacterium]